MIVEYFRPQDIQETLDLLDNQTIKTVLIGGGSAIDRYQATSFAVIDLQDVGLEEIYKKSNFLEIGATVRLQSLLENPQVLKELKRIITLEATYNLRQVATVAGTLIAANGRSPFATAMLALDATLTLMPGEVELPLGEVLFMRGEKLGSRLITKITIPTNLQLAYDQVARSPADLPIVCAAVATWPGGRTRVTLGGFGEAPVLAFDGPVRNGEVVAASDAYSHAGDEWASADYRQEIASILVKRCLARFD